MGHPSKADCCILALTHHFTIEGPLEFRDWERKAGFSKRKMAKAPETVLSQGLCLLPARGRLRFVLFPLLRSLVCHLQIILHAEDARDRIGADIPAEGHL